MWRAFRVVAASGLIVTLGCGPAAPKNAYTLHGQVLSVEAPRKTLTIKHDQIQGLMPAMTMPYTVRDEKLLNGIAAGDLVTATLVLESNDAYLATVTKTGSAPLEPAPPDAPMPAPPAVKLLQPGEEVPGARFVDQDGRARTFAAFKGAPVVMTFIYTRCPLPSFCPLMDRNFAKMQASFKQDPSFARVHLVTVSFDPERDTPSVLKAHARELHADLTRWTFLTGNRDDIERFAAGFGVAVSRAVNDPRDITHNLRTVVVDSDGRLVKTYNGNDWTPQQVLADLRPLAPRA